MSAELIKALLRDKYQEKEWALAFEVSDTPGSPNRYADAIAMNLWPSRGLSILGFEFKVNRPDWLKELRSPEKAELIAKYCDHWWVVTTQGIVKPSELPVSWGLMEVGGDRLVVVKEAPKKDAAPVTREFLASLFRRQSKADHALIDEEVRRRLEPRIKQLDDEVNVKVKEGIRIGSAELAQLRESLDEVKRITGLDLPAFKYQTAEFGRAVNFVLNCKIHGAYGSVEYVLNNLRESLGRVDEVIRCHNEGREYTEPSPVERRALRRQVKAD
jgi:hypothetical protein